MRATPLRIQYDGTLIESEFVPISIPSPQIRIHEFEILNIATNGDVSDPEFTCSIRCRGEVMCHLSDHIPGRAGEITRGILTVNNSGKEDRVFEIQAQKEEFDSRKKEFKYTGKFEAQFDGIQFIEGNNVYQLTVESPYFLVEGHTLYCAQFSHPDDPSYYSEEDAENLSVVAKLEGGPSLVSSGGLGEIHPFLLAVQEDIEHLILEKLGDFGICEIDERQVLCRNKVPVFFVLVPLNRELETDVSSEDLKKFGSCFSDEHSRFLSGFWAGNSASGLELMALDDFSKVSLEKRSLSRFALNTNVDESSLSMEIRCDQETDFHFRDDAISEMLFDVWKGRKVGDSDFISSLIMWNVEELGIKGLPSGDWRETIFNCMHLHLHLFLKEYDQADESIAGYVLGRYIGAALRRNLDPEHPVHRQDHGLGNFLADLVEDRFFEESGFGYCAYESIQGSVGAINKARAWAGR